MKKILMSVKRVSVISLVVIGLGVLMYCDHYIWRAEHPDAKGWTYFLRSK